MGWDPQKGLGKKGDGILEPISAYKKISYKAGIGSEINIENKKHLYKPIEYDIIVNVNWCPLLINKKSEFEFDINYKKHINCAININNNDINYNNIYTSNELFNWLTVKNKCNTVGIEWNNTYCNINLQKEMFNAKTQFDNIGESLQFRDARNKSNPFEMIKKEIFQNRAALKMCEIDYSLNYEITRPLCCSTFNKNKKNIFNNLIYNWKMKLNNINNIY